MPDGVFNIAKGKAAYYATLPATADALIVVPIETTGLEADDILNNYDDLAALLAGTSNEQTTMGRKTAASVVLTVDDTANRADADMADIVWAAATGNAVSKLLVCYDGDTAAGTDANIIPLTHHDFVVTPDGTDITATVNVAGFYRAA
jgi:hypothetical protein